MVSDRFKITSVMIILFIIGVFLVFGVLSQDDLEKKHEEEIIRVISSRNGVVISIDERSKEESPFVESNSGNIIYEITYEHDGKMLTAWYRGTKVLNDIHSSGKGYYDEKWLFE